MRFWAVSIVCVLLAGCQTVPSAEVAPGPDGLAFEVKSWGALVHSWSVRADGTATSVTRISESGSPWLPYALEHRRFVLNSEQLARPRALASEIPRPVPTDQACENRFTDAAYGCFDAYYAPFIGKVKAIDALVMGVSEMAAVERREEIAPKTD